MQPDERGFRIAVVADEMANSQAAGFDVLALYGSLAGSAVGWDSPRVNVVAQRPK